MKVGSAAVKAEIVKSNPAATPQEIDDKIMARARQLAANHGLIGVRPMEHMKARFNTSDVFMEEQLRRIHMLCKSKFKHPILILGPSGTGKELMASIAHEIANPMEKFIAVNCASIPSELFESHMFGHEPGAFTGAVRTQYGAVERAEEGTLFLDEIGELALHHQAKILRLLQERKFNRVGSFTEQEVHCRFIFATHRNLKRMVWHGEFRADLYYRICTFIVHTTPLSTRPDDAQHIARLIADKMGMTEDEFSTLPKEIIDSPGNVRAIEAYLLRKKIWMIGDDDACDGLDAQINPDSK
jgi:transcriptional regulator with PAS, ATPase and Fis domain